jgi:hypothetical protein
VKSDAPRLEMTGIFTPQLRGKRASSTSSVSSPTTIILGEPLLELIGTGYKSPLYWDQAKISMEPSESWVSGGRGTNMRFFTTLSGENGMVERMRIAGNGYLGIGVGNNDPLAPLHINYSNNASNFASGVMMIGGINSTHLNLDGNQIESWAGTQSAPLFLNYYSQGTVRIGNGPNGADLDVNGYTNLGDGAPKIKMKKLTSRTRTTNNAVVQRMTISHGVSSASKILSVVVSVEKTPGEWIAPAFKTDSESDSIYTFSYDDTYVELDMKRDESDDILDKPIKVLVTYEE